MQEKINFLAEKLSIGRKNADKIIAILEYIKSCDFSIITEEMCDRLIEKATVNIYEKRGVTNYGKQHTAFYLYDIGKIEDLVDVRYKPYSQRIEEAIPKLWKDGKVYVSHMCDELGITYPILKKALRYEGKSFTEILIKKRIETIQSYVNQGISVDEVCEIMKFTDKKFLDSFCRDNFGTRYEKIYPNKIE